MILSKLSRIIDEKSTFERTERFIKKIILLCRNDDTNFE